MDRSSLWALVIKNSICVVCWVVLAIVFNKWWVALFGLLFMSGITIRYKRVCDKCGKRPYAMSRINSIKKAERLGWIMVNDEDGFKDYCSDCREEV